MDDVWNCLNTKRSMIAHAPTGLGKTVAALAPALTFALEHNLNIIFLTSRHTQHVIALETLRKIKTTYSLSFIASSIIGKKWMCSQSGVENMFSSEFSEFCRVLREEDKCDYYLKTKKNNQETADAALLVSQLSAESPIPIDTLIKDARKKGMCPYEIGQFLAQQAQVIVTDYYYIFHPKIGENFLAKTNKKLENTILIIDEGHNLASRIRETMSTQLSNLQIQGAIKEAIKFSLEETRLLLIKLQDVLSTLADGVKGEEVIECDDLISLVSKIKPIESLISLFEHDGKIVRTAQQRSFIGSIADFLNLWIGVDDGFVRYISVRDSSKGSLVTIIYRCLDPSYVTKPIIDAAYMVLLMSGTLTPTEMYADLLGFPLNTYEQEYESPFDENNRLTLICPAVTTKYSSRSEDQFQRIAKICADIVNTVPGNSALFFPSYVLLNKINEYFQVLNRKTSFLEQSDLSTQEKHQLLETFKSYNKTGAVLLGVASGSFGEGIDLPGDLLQCVVVVGLPLSKPDLETQQLIRYYHEKFGKGWDYGYVLPAVTKTLQNAGRCIRSETDRGVVVFLDERYAWPQYIRCFPSSWELKITKDCTSMISDFFMSQGSISSNKEDNQ
mgnify:FL=1